MLFQPSKMMCKHIVYEQDFWWKSVMNCWRVHFHKDASMLPVFTALFTEMLLMLLPMLFFVAIQWNPSKPETMGEFISVL